MIDFDNSHSPTAKFGVYVIQGDPVPLQRARHGRGRTWDAQSALKHAIGVEIALQHKNKPLFSGPLLLKITFFMPIAQSKSQKQQRYLESKPHIQRPDLSNLIKLIEDVAASILYDDDCLIADIIATKRYDKNPRTEFIIEELR